MVEQNNEIKQFKARVIAKPKDGDYTISRSDELTEEQAVLCVFLARRLCLCTDQCIEKYINLYANILAQMIVEFQITIDMLAKIPKTPFLMDMGNIIDSFSLEEQKFTSRPFLINGFFRGMF